MNTCNTSLLIVEDDDTSRELLTRRLAKEGYIIATANNGREAIERLHLETFDLMLLDIMMPDIDGFEVLQNVRSDPTLQHMPIIMVTAMNDRDSVMRCVQLGANDYITKPIDMAIVKSRVWRCLQHRLSEHHVRSTGQAANSGQVLIVDDHEMNRDLLERRVTGQGHAATTASDGVEALEMLQTQPFDLVLLDINMPNMDGKSVLRQMKFEDRLKNIPVIMISALDDDETINECIQAGADDYIAKPFNAALLKVRMNSLICIKQDGAYNEEYQEKAHPLAHSMGSKDQHIV